jgi:hypothetical protein
MLLSVYGEYMFLYVECSFLIDISVDFLSVDGLPQYGSFFWMPFGLE